MDLSARRVEYGTGRPLWTFNSNGNSKAEWPLIDNRAAEGRPDHQKLRGMILHPAPRDGIVKVRRPGRDPVHVRAEIDIVAAAGSQVSRRDVHHLHIAVPARGRGGTAVLLDNEVEVAQIIRAVADIGIAVPSQDDAQVLSRGLGVRHKEVEALVRS